MSNDDEKGTSKMSNQAKGAAAGALLGLGFGGVLGAIRGALGGRSAVQKIEMQETLKKFNERQQDGRRRAHPDGTID